MWANFGVNVTEKSLKKSIIDIFRKNKYYNSRGRGKILIKMGGR